LLKEGEGGSRGGVRGRRNTPGQDGLSDSTGKREGQRRHEGEMEDGEAHGLLKKLGRDPTSGLTHLIEKSS